ncbi:Ycf48-like protein precursor [bacterium BMS3Abin03]|nr:Ycf48-like protein precursor [bacterium BMS3Abin03]
MKTKNIIYLFAFLSLITTNSFAQWEWQNPKPQGNDILHSYFLDEYNGWAVGNYGACIKTSDGGETWEHIQMPINNNLASVHFLDSSIGFVGDWEGNLLKTTDGGNNWSIQHIDDYADIYVFFINQNYGWLLSSGFATATYKIYRTSNGGANWQSYLINTTHIMNDLFFVDSSKGFVAGGFGDIYMTTDGGISWSQINSPTSEFLYKIKFKNPLDGFIVGSSGTLLQTTDGGYNWQSRYLGQNWLWDISFLNESKGIIVGNDFNIFITSDGGTTWMNKTFSSIWALRASNYLNETDIIVFGEKGNIYKSTNNGNNWDSKVSGDRNTIADIIFIDYKTGYTVGNAGTILKTTNRGKSWNKLNPLTNESLHSISFSDNLHGWIVGANSVLLKSINGGQNWQLDTIPDSYDLTSVFFINNNVGWVAGKYNKILKSTDGGETWITQQINISQSITIKSLSIIDENIGYACGIYEAYYPPKSFILKTTNGGNNWDVIKTENSYFNSTFFHNSLNGWVVGQTQDRTLHTTDGGINWITVDIGGGNDIFFSNNQNGIIVANYSLGSDILITGDGGETWSLQPRVTDRSLYSAYGYLNGLWATGYNGTILFNDKLIITDVIDSNNYKERPNNYNILQNYPNPFNPSTKIKFTIAPPNLPGGEAFVTLKVYDVLGREVATLVNEEKPPGSYEVEFDGSNLPSGVYFYRLKAGNYSQVKKMVLLR